MAWLNEVIGEVLNPPPPTKEQKVRNFLDTLSIIGIICVGLIFILAVGALIGVVIYRNYHG